MADKQHDQSSHYAFAMTVLTRAMEAGEEILGVGAVAMMRRFGRPLSRVILGSDRFELTGLVSFEEAVTEAAECLNYMGVFGAFELLEQGENLAKFKYTGCVRRLEEYGKDPGKMMSCPICLGLLESFFRAATGNKRFYATLDSFDEHSCFVTIDLK